MLFMPGKDCISIFGQSWFLKMANMIADRVLKVGCRCTTGKGSKGQPWTDRVCWVALVLLQTCCRFLETDFILAKDELISEH